MKTHLQHLVLLAACVAGMPALALEPPRQVNVGSELNGRRQHLALTPVFAGASHAGTQTPTIEPGSVEAKNIGRCEIYDPANPSANELHPVAAIGAYVQFYQRAHLAELKATDYSVKYVELPQHGTVKSVTQDGWLVDYYIPTNGYAGNDRYVAEVTVKGVKFKVAGYIRPSSDVMSDYVDICRRLGLPGASWKISDTGDGSASQTAMSMPQGPRDQESKRDESKRDGFISPHPCPHHHPPLDTLT